ncbi:Doublecortin domain-containing protein 2B [Mactra antiquata]
MATKNHPKGSKLPNGYVTKGGGDDNDRSDRMPAYMTPNPRAFKVVVHKNSDSNNPGKKLTVGRNKHSTFEQFLDECTEKLKPAFGAARRLYTSRGTRRVFRMEDLCEDSIYVITGTESFKPLK